MCDIVAGTTSNALRLRKESFKLRESASAFHVGCANTYKSSGCLKNAYTTTILGQKMIHRMAKEMIPPGLEPGTACVLDRSDNQLHHRTNY